MLRLPIILVVLVLIVLGWLLWSAWDTGPSDPQETDRSGPVADDESAADTQRGPEGEDAAKAPTLESNPHATPPKPALPSLGAKAEPEPRRRIVVHLHDYDPALPGVAQLRLEGNFGAFSMPDTGSGVAGTLFREGDARESTFDLTDDVANPRAFTLRIYVDHPAYLPATGVLELPSRAETSSGPPPAVDVHMRRAFSLLIRVHDPDGKPLPSVGIAVHRAGPEGHVVDPKKRYVSSAVDEILGGGRASWRLRVPEAGRYIVTAAAHGRLHVTRTVEVSETETELDPFVLREGAIISGRVRVAGRVPTGCTVVAHPVETGFEFQVAGQSARRLRGALLPGSATATVRPDGTFRVIGLGVEEYRVYVQSIGVPRTAAALFGTSKRVVRAPADDVRLVVAGARISVHVRDSDGEPWDGNPLLLRDKGKPLPPDVESALAEHEFLQGETDADGCAEFAVPTDTAWHVLVESEGMRHAPLRVDAPAANVVTDAHITLARAPAPDTAEITVTLRSPGREVRGLLEMRLERLGDRGPDGYSISEYWSGARTGTLAVPPGRWRLRVARGDSADESMKLLLPAERELEVAPGKPQAVTLTLGYGGLLRISALDAKGGFIAAGCTVRDAEGRVLDLRFSHFGAHHRMLNDVRLGGESPSTATMAVAAGTYTVEFEHDDYERETREVEVRSGKTTAVEVRLEPR